MSEENSVSEPELALELEVLTDIDTAVRESDKVANRWYMVAMISGSMAATGFLFNIVHEASPTKMTITAGLGSLAVWTGKKFLDAEDAHSEHAKARYEVSQCYRQAK